ncbi:peptide MFS transporter [Clostridium aciditolerans]|uniref:Peptide MFS transporter n=1 Tax=Clostridium aciditolerans TaxID=339861 RepID=A0A934M297_9CLOT|nr:peptide MFS transporter [Clostridium aciditolerans]MBI6871695.1 peptide MFS transporter [Clostridium aciditolerans]
MNGQTSTPVEVKQKHPAALYLLGLTFTFERFAYYGGKPIIVYFLAYSLTVGGLGISKTEATVIAANLGAFTYLAPIFGGIIADKWLGPRYCVILGSIIMSIGWSLGYFATSAAWINALIIVVSIGTGLFKGNINTMVGELYEKDDPRKDMAFSITYSFVNGGAFVGSLTMATAYIYLFGKRNASGEVLLYGFRQSYLLAAAVCLISLFAFLIACRSLGDAGKRPNCLANPNNKEVQKVDHSKPLTKKERNQVAVILILATFSIFFWLFYNQAETSLLLYIDKYTNFNVGGFKVPPTWTTTSFNGLLCVVLAAPMAAIWAAISKKRKGVDFTMTQKIALGYIFLAIGFLVMVGAEFARGGNEGANSSILWILMFTLMQTIGELCFSPLGTSVVSRTAPAKYLSLLMGVWFFATFVAQKGSGYIETFIVKFGTMQIFILIPSILLVGAVILLACNKKITELTE